MVQQMAGAFRLTFMTKIASIPDEKLWLYMAEFRDWIGELLADHTADSSDAISRKSTKRAIKHQQ